MVVDELGLEGAEIGGFGGGNGLVGLGGVAGAAVHRRRWSEERERRKNRLGELTTSYVDF